MEIYRESSSEDKTGDNINDLLKNEGLEVDTETNRVFFSFGTRLTSIIIFIIIIGISAYVSFFFITPFVMNSLETPSPIIEPEPVRPVIEVNYTPVANFSSNTTTSSNYEQLNRGGTTFNVTTLTVDEQLSKFGIDPNLMMIIMFVPMILVFGVSWVKGNVFWIMTISLFIALWGLLLNSGWILLTGVCIGIICALYFLKGDMD